jgi:hypothetical protein
MTHERQVNLLDLTFARSVDESLGSIPAAASRRNEVNICQRSWSKEEIIHLGYQVRGEDRNE